MQVTAASSVIFAYALHDPLFPAKENDGPEDEEDAEEERRDQDDPTKMEDNLVLEPPPERSEASVEDVRKKDGLVVP